MLFDGTVTLTVEGEDPYQYLTAALTLEDTFENGKKTTFTIDGDSLSCLSYNDQASDSSTISVFENDGTWAINCALDVGAGEHTLKITQEDDEYDVIYDGEITLADYEATFTPLASLTDGKAAALTFATYEWGLSEVADGGTSFEHGTSTAAIFVDEDDPTKLTIQATFETGTFDLYLIQYKTPIYGE